MGVKPTVNQGRVGGAEQQGAIAGQPTTFQNMDAQSGQFVEKRHTHLDVERTPFSRTGMDTTQQGVNP